MLIFAFLRQLSSKFTVFYQKELKILQFLAAQRQFLRHTQILSQILEIVGIWRGYAALRADLNRVGQISAGLGRSQRSWSDLNRLGRPEPLERSGACLGSETAE